MDYEAIIRALVDSIVEHPESLMVRISDDGKKDINVLVCAEKDDTARLIGRKGVVASALREMVSVAGKTEGKRIHLKFESFESEEE